MNWGYVDAPDHAFVAGFDLGLAAETYVADQATFLIPGARYEATVGGWADSLGYLRHGKSAMFLGGGAEGVGLGLEGFEAEVPEDSGVFFL